MRQIEKIYGVTASQLDCFNPAEYDAIREADGTYTLAPLAWTNQEEFEDYAWGCGDDGRDDTADDYALAIAAEEATIEAAYAAEVLDTAEDCPF